MVDLNLHKNKVIIIGNPNVGKSLLFSKICNSYSFVSNYPKTTLDVKKEKVFIGEHEFELIDSPGINSLTITSEEEIITRDILLGEHPELIIQCANASNLNRALNLHIQLRELGKPIIFCLNMIDEAEKKDIVINTRFLKEELGVPIVENATLHEEDINKLKEAIVNLKEKESNFTRYTPQIEALIKELAEVFPDGRKPSRAMILLYILNDKSIIEKIQDFYGREIADKLDMVIGRSLHENQVNIPKTIERVRGQWVDKVAKHVISKNVRERKSGLDNIGWASRHPVYGWPILVALLYLLYVLVGDVAGAITGLFETFLFAPLIELIESMTRDPVVLDILIGDYGLFTMGILNAIGTVIPILFVFFILLSFLEDTGYLPNLSVLVTRLLQVVGLNGRAVMSLILAFGCNTMATMTTRMLETQKERTIAIFIIALGIPCSVQFGIMLAILASIHFSGIFIVFGTVIALQLTAAILLKKYIKDEEETFFMMELTPIRVPNFKNILMKTYLRCKWFLFEALPLFVYGSIALLVMKYTGFLSFIREVLKPVVETFLQLPIQVTDVFLMVLARREVGVILYKNLTDSGYLDFIQIIVGLTAITLFVPCISNTMVMIKEIGLMKAGVMISVILFLAIFIAGVLNFTLRLLV